MIEVTFDSRAKSGGVFGEGIFYLLAVRAVFKRIKNISIYIETR